jgi:hypothetical protein
MTPAILDPSTEAATVPSVLGVPQKQPMHRQALLPLHSKYLNCMNTATAEDVHAEKCPHSLSALTLFLLLLAFFPFSLWTHIKHSQPIF